MVTTAQLDSIFNILQWHNVSLWDLTLHILRNPRHSNPMTSGLTEYTTNILAALLVHSDSSVLTTIWVLATARNIYAQSLKELTNASSGWHFNALDTSAEQLENFDMMDMAAELEKKAPHLWALLDSTLSAGRKDAQHDADGDTIMTDDMVSDLVNDDDDNSDDEYWADVEGFLEDESEDLGAGRKSSQSVERRLAVNLRRRKDLIRVVRHICSSSDAIHM